MPAPQFILDSATAIANDWWGLAIAWHVWIGALLAALVLGWRPSARLLAWVFAIPFLSVSALASAAGNPFNGIVFALMFVTLGVLALRQSRQPLRFASPMAMVVGSCLIAFGWCYPHFVEAPNWITYAYASPFGLLPCPTLATVIGIALMVEDLRTTAWSSVLAAGGVIYGAIGVFILGVTLDYALLAGAAILAANVQFARVRARPTTTSHENFTKRWSSASRMRS